MLISSKLNDILSLIYYDHSVCLTTDFLGHLLCCWRGDPRITVQMPCMLGCVWYDMIGFAAGGALANHLLFSFSLQLQEECMRVHIMSGCEFECMCSVCVCVCVCARLSLSGFACVPSVLQCWRVEARVCLRSEISQISYCLCSFSVHALWFTTPRASYANDAAFSEGFLPELKHAPLVTMMLLGLGDLNKSVSNLRLFCFIKSAFSLRFLYPLTRSH